MPQPIAVWNSARGAWEVPETENLICEHSELFSETWPSSGMTRNGWAYALPTSAPLTVASGFSSLLPTPNAADGMGGPRHSGRDGGLNLRTAAALLPTPTTRDVKGQNQRGDDSCLTGALLPTPRASDGTKGGPNQRGSSGDLMLPSAVQGFSRPARPADTALSAAAMSSLGVQAEPMLTADYAMDEDDRTTMTRASIPLLPTPTASVPQDGESPETWEARRKIAAEKHGNNGIGMPLTIAVQLLPTLRAQHGETRNQKIWARPLDQPQNLENALARFPGEFTNPRSDAGSPYSGD